MRNNSYELTPDEIDKAFERSTFNTPKEDVLKYTLLAYASGYLPGVTATRILYKLGLITFNNNLTKKGKWFLYEWFKGESTL